MKLCDVSKLGEKDDPLDLVKGEPCVLLMDEAHAPMSENKNKEKAMEITNTRLKTCMEQAADTNLIVLFTGTPVQEDEDRLDLTGNATPQLLSLACGVRLWRNILVSWNMADANPFGKSVSIFISVYSTTQHAGARGSTVKQARKAR